MSHVWPLGDSSHHSCDDEEGTLAAVLRLEILRMFQWSKPFDEEARMPMAPGGPRFLASILSERV